MIDRVAIAPPMLALVNGLPLWPSTVAPALRARSASNMSPVMTTSRGVAVSAIQSSAASKASLTTTRSTKKCSGTRIRMLLTSLTATARRKATRYTSSFTGQASASTRIRASLIASSYPQRQIPPYPNPRRAMALTEKASLFAAR